MHLTSPQRNTLLIQHSALQYTHFTAIHLTTIIHYLSLYTPLLYTPLLLPPPLRLTALHSITHSAQHARTQPHTYSRHTPNNKPGGTGDN